MNSEKIEPEILSFEDVLQRESYVICDTSITSPTNSDWYGDGVYRARNFSEINPECVEQEISHLKYFIGFLENPNVFVARGVSLQLQRARDMVADKIRYLNIKEKSGKRNGKHSGEDKTILLHEVHDLFHESYREARRVSFLPKQKEKYDSLERIVMDVTERTAAKIDLDEVYDERAKPKKVEDFHADEQTTAAAIYLSLIENKEGGILTRNSDIERILANTLSYLFYSSRNEFNRFFSQARTNKIRIYFVSRFQQAEPTFDSSNFLPIKERLSNGVIEYIDREAKFL